MRPNPDHPRHQRELPMTHWARGALASDRALVCALGAAILTGGALVFYTMRHTGLTGDEYTYVDGASAMGGLLTHPGHGAAAAFETVIGTGWFMPGMAVLGAPLFALDPQPSFAAIRAYAALSNLAILAMVHAVTRQTLGRLAALLVMLFPALAALWQMAAFSFLPDIPGGLFAALGLLFAYRSGLDLLRGAAPPWHRLLLGEAMFVVAIYLRGPLILMACAVNASLIVLCVVAGHARLAWRIAAAALLVPALVLPWSLAASRHFDSVVVTTTNFPLVIADSFGNPRQTCFGPCPPGADIWPAWHFAQDVARRSGDNPLTVERRLMASSLHGLTWRGYLQQVRQHFGTFLFAPASQFAVQLHNAYGVPARWRPAMLHWIGAQSLVLYVPFMLALLATNVGVFRRDMPGRLQSLLIKLATACCLVQPFVHKSSGRYWVELAPLCACSAALLIRSARAAHAPPAANRATMWLDRLQRAYVCLFAVCATTILIA